MSIEHILITGAAGFVGCRLAERLSQSTDYRVTAMVRRYYGRGVPRLARLPIRWALADILDPKTLSEACRGVDAIVHLAYGGNEANTVGTQNILNAARANGVKKVVHMSTAAVHGLNPQGPVVTETAPYEENGDDYRASKARGETIIQKFQADHDLPVVVLKPPLIYGPFSRAWSVRLVQEIINGAVLVNGGSGTANLVYIDNLIDAILLAIEKDTADGEAMFVVDDDIPTWKGVYDGYAAMINQESRMQSMSVEEIERQRKQLEPTQLDRWVSDPIRIGTEIVKGIARNPSYTMRLLQVPWIKFLAKDMLPGSIKDRLKGVNQKRSSQAAGQPVDSLPPLPPRDMVDLYASQSAFSNEKIKRLLGFEPRVGFDEGMELTRQWLAYYRFIAS
jgi:nucleoside-diphosphate-sugar epimerase